MFEKDKVNVYDANNTMITVSQEAVLRGWREKGKNLWQIPIVETVYATTTRIQ